MFLKMVVIIPRHQLSGTIPVLIIKLNNLVIVGAILLQASLINSLTIPSGPQALLHLSFLIPFVISSISNSALINEFSSVAVFFTELFNPIIKGISLDFVKN